MVDLHSQLEEMDQFSRLVDTSVRTEDQENDGSLIVSSGLQNSTHIVASGVHHLTDGQQVSMIKKTSSLNVGNLK